MLRHIDKAVRLNDNYVYSVFRIKVHKHICKDRNMIKALIGY